jgi:hypothetical protein
VPRGIPYAVGYRAVRDTVLCGIPCCAGYRAARDTVPCGTRCACRVCTVVAICGLPPGGGKSTFFDALQKLGAAIERAPAPHGACSAHSCTLPSSSPKPFLLHAGRRFGSVYTMSSVQSPRMPKLPHLRRDGAHPMPICACAADRTVRTPLEIGPNVRATRRVNATSEWRVVRRFGLAALLVSART